MWLYLYLNFLQQFQSTEERMLIEMTEQKLLEREIRVGGLTLRNRLVMPAMPGPKRFLWLIIPGRNFSMAGYPPVL